MGEGSAIPTDPQHTPTFIPLTSQPQKTQKPRKYKRKDTEIPQSSGPNEHVIDEAVYKERGDRLMRAATTASSLEAEQDSGGGPKRQETMGDTIAQTWFENVSKTSNDSLLAGVWISQKSQENSQKTGKHGHGNQKSSKRSQRFKAEARKVKPQVKSVNHEAITSLLSSINHVSNGESTRGVGFCAKLTHKTSTNVTSKNDMLAILRCPQFDQTATIEAQMIEEMIG
ncbi:hypothetical protein Tco_0399841 [Tanacetum coccineum]